MMQPGESARLTLCITAEDVSVWDEAHAARSNGLGWLAAAGRFVASVGASSRDLRLHTHFDVE